jgi:hypothetical protein
VVRHVGAHEVGVGSESCADGAVASVGNGEEDTCEQRSESGDMQLIQVCGENKLLFLLLRS